MSTTKGSGAKTGAKKRGTRKTAAAKKSPAKRLTRAGWERVQIMVKRSKLDLVTELIGAKSKSEAVNAALDSICENALVLAGIDAAAGTIPDFPHADT